MGERLIPIAWNNSPMLTTAPDTSADLAANLLVHYSFDLNGYNASELINRWQAEYPINWLHLAVIEALYQGRYKAISVQQILIFWLRRGQVLHHFNMEFERLICSKFPEKLTKISPPVLPSIPQLQSIESARSSKLLPTQANNRQQQSKVLALAVANAEETKQVVTSPSFQVVGDTSKQQLAKSVSQRLISQGSFSDPAQLPKLLPGNSNNPPIGQFTPQRSDRSESFTSKLKAMTHEQPEFAF